MNNRFVKNIENCNRERVIELLTIKTNMEKTFKYDLIELKKLFLNKTLSFDEEIKILLGYFNNNLELNNFDIHLNNNRKIVIKEK
jgi:hypothetical protein